MHQNRKNEWKNQLWKDIWRKYRNPKNNRRRNHQIRRNPTNPKSTLHELLTPEWATRMTWANAPLLLLLLLHQWLCKTTKRVIKSYRRPIKVPQNAFIVLMIYEKKPMIDTICISSMQRSNVDLEVHNINFPTRVINWKTLTTSLSWLYIYHQLGSKIHFQVPLNQPHYF